VGSLDELCTQGCWSDEPYEFSAVSLQGILAHNTSRAICGVHRAEGHKNGETCVSGSALQASKLLYQTVEGLRPSQRAARQLRDEVQALSQSLEVLKNVAVEYESELPTLCLPLSQCGAVCKELSNKIAQWVKNSDGRASCPGRS
jgi:hypothetical protein